MRNFAAYVVLMETSLDKFLDGRLALLQPKSGFRAGTDSVLLAAGVDAQEGETVLELGVGVGVVLCCLAKRVPNLDLWGLEKNDEVAELAMQNLKSSGFKGRIFKGNVCDPPKGLMQKQFDHIVMNPPYFSQDSHSLPKELYNQNARIAEENLNNWVRLAYKRLKPKGLLTLVHRVEALAEILELVRFDFGDIQILPIQSRPQKSAKSVIIKARKDRKGPLELLSPLALYDEAGVVSEAYERIARHAKALTF